MNSANNVVNITAGRFKGVLPQQANVSEKPKDRVFFVSTQNHPKFEYGERVTLVRFESGTIIARNAEGVTGSIKEVDFTDVWMKN